MEPYVPSYERSHHAISSKTGQLDHLIFRPPYKRGVSFSISVALVSSCGSVVEGERRGTKKRILQFCATARNSEALGHRHHLVALLRQLRRERLELTGEVLANEENIHESPCQGLNNERASISSKSRVLRVANVRPCTKAMDAIWPSSTLIGRPHRMRKATISA